MDAPRLLSPVMRDDLSRIAQRMIDIDGRISIRKLHTMNRHRIPGTIGQYAQTVMYLVNRNRLRFSRSNKK